MCMLIDTFQGDCDQAGSVQRIFRVVLIQKFSLILVDNCSYCPDRY